MSSSPPTAGALVENVLAGKLGVLRRILEQVRRDVGERVALSSALELRVGEHYGQLKDDLLALQTFPLIFDRTLDQRRQTLEARLDRLGEERRRERVEQWRDVAILRREFREWFREYEALSQRVALVSRSQAGPTRDQLVRE